MILPSLQQYIQKEIIPVYATFDKGHDTNHVNAVIERSLRIASELPEKLDLNMVYVVAAYHDYGMKIARKGHNMHSGALLRQDQNLAKWFTPEQTETMAQAAEDHSTSSQSEPRSIYGKIVCDADKDNDVTVSLTRALEFSLANNTHFSMEQHYENCYQHLHSKFGQGGLVHFYLSTSINNAFLQQIRHLATNKNLAIDAFKQIAASITKNGVN